MFRVTHTLLGGRALGQIGRTTINYAQFGTAVTASMVKELRESSGAPMMDCKKALTESDADMEKAMDWLRAKGIAKAVKSASREATEGLIGVRSMTSGGLILIEVNSETDFVSRNDDFHKFVTNIADRTKAMHEANQLTVGGDGKVDTQAFLQADGGAMQNMLTDAINVIRENIVLRRIECIEGMGAGGGEEVLSSYVHGKVYSASDLTLGTQASVVSLVGGPGLVDKHEHVAEIGRKLAMHVVAAAPMYATHAEVPNDFLEREQAVLREQMEESGQTKGKAPDMVEKILKGKVSKRLSEVCMTSQAHFAEEGSPVVEKHLKAQAGTLSLTNLALGGFRRWTLGSN